MRSLAAMMNDAVGFALCYSLVHCLDDQLCCLPIAHPMIRQPSGDHHRGKYGGKVKIAWRETCPRAAGTTARAGRGIVRVGRRKRPDVDWAAERSLSAAQDPTSRNTGQWRLSPDGGGWVYLALGKNSC